MGLITFVLSDAEYDAGQATATRGCAGVRSSVSILQTFDDLERPYLLAAEAA